MDKAAFLAMIAAKKGKKGSKVPAKKKMSRAETLAALAAATALFLIVVLFPDSMPLNIAG